MLKNSKAFKFLIGTFVVAAFAFAATASALDFGTTTLRVGSRGAGVMAVQTLVGATADGNFGPMTKAKVMAWQAANGLTADGVFGPMSMAKANGAVSGNFPAGCTSAAGYSSTTGMPCNSTNANTFPAGCTSASGYSPTTGVKCDSSSSSNSGPLMGGAGSATITELSTPSSSTKVGEGDVNTKVYGVEVEADNNSDLAITSMKITLVNGGSGSKKLDRYVKNVSIWYDGAKVGSALPSEFSEDSNTYTKSIALSGAIVRADKIGKFYVAVDAIADIDSGNTGSTNNTWTITLASTRYTDAAGAVITDTTGSLSNTFIFDTLASTQDVELKTNLSSSTPVSSTIKVSTTNNTNQVELMKFTMKAQGSKMVIDQIPVSFTTSHTLYAATDNVTLKIGDKVFNETISSGTDTNGSATIGTASTAVRIFDDLGLELAAGETITGTVLADIKDIDGNFTEGTTLYASITSALVAATSGNYIDVEDSNGDQLATGDRTGSAIGNTMTFRSTGVNTVMGTPTLSRTSDTSGNVTSVTYSIPVAVTSFGNTLYMGQSASLATSVAASKAFNVVLELDSAPTSENTSATTSITLSTSDAVIESNGFRLDDGQTKHFTVNVTVTEATNNKSIRVRLDQIQTYTGAGLESAATATASDLLPTTNFRTDYQYLFN
jgi:peptidoglycan hydrolase-like protein with peptidoglycan-binding domain